MHQAAGPPANRRGHCDTAERIAAADQLRPSGAVLTAQPRTHHRAFPARADQVREARKFLAVALASCPVAEEATLCLSELASNSVLHSASRKPGGIFTVRAQVQKGDYVRIEVQDAGGPWNEPAHGDSRPHGLDIVRALASDCGISGDSLAGWTVWARLDWPGPRPPGPDQPDQQELRPDSRAPGRSRRPTEGTPMAAMTPDDPIPVALALLDRQGPLSPALADSAGAEVMTTLERNPRYVIGRLHQILTTLLAADLPPMDAPTSLLSQALADAIAWRRHDGRPCRDCLHSLCARCDADWDLADRYHALALDLGAIGDRPAAEMPQRPDPP